MATDVSVVIAHRDMGCPYRGRAFGFVYGWYLQVAARWALDDVGWGTDIIVDGGADDATFARASSINTAIRESTGRVIVQADPDNLVSPTQLRKAVELAGEHDGLVFPHDRYVRLNQSATADFVAGRRTLGMVTASDDCEGRGPEAPGGVVVFSRSTWDAAGGFDERFGLWGGDDAAFAYAAAAFTAANRRLSGTMTHLWHPRLPQSEPGHPAYVEQFAILTQYRDAAAIGDRAVRELVLAR